MKLENYFEPWLQAKGITPKSDEDRAVLLSMFANENIAGKRLLIKHDSSSVGVLKIENLEMCDALLQAYRVNGVERESMQLTTKQWKTLKYLALRFGQTVTRDEILDNVWAQINVYQRNVDTHISQIRKKLVGTGLMIRAQHGVGYVLDKDGLQ